MFFLCDWQGTVRGAILYMGSSCYLPCAKIRTVWFYNALMHPNDSDGITNIVDLDQTAPKGAV